MTRWPTSGCCCVYWAEPDDAMAVLGLCPHRARRGSRRAPSVLERYAAASGRDISGVGYYMAFGYWKLALHPPGRLRPLRGRGGRGRPGSVDGYPEQIRRLFELAGEALEAAP